MTAPDLLPCPFCGCSVGIERSGPACAIVCLAPSKCLKSGLLIGFSPDEEAEAIAAWNRRAPLADAHPLASEALAVSEVAALVYAAKMVMHDLHHGNGLEGLYENRDRLDAALHAIGGDA